MSETTPLTRKEPYHYLQDLLERAVDAQKGYHKAADLTDSPGLQQFFAENSGQRASFARELENVLRANGIDPVNSGTFSAKLHQGWMSVVSRIGRGEESLLNECQRGEEKALSDYEEALRSMELPVDVAGVVERQRDRLKNELFALRELQEFDALVA